VREDQVREIEQPPLAPGGRERGPAACSERRAGGRDGRIDVPLAARCDLGEDPPRRRIDRVESRSVGCGQEAAADEGTAFGLQRCGTRAPFLRTWGGWLRTIDDDASLVVRLRPNGGQWWRADPCTPVAKL
jgi:hypothetical protein